MEPEMRVPGFWSYSQARKGCLPRDCCGKGGTVPPPRPPAVSEPESKGDHKKAGKLASQFLPLLPAPCQPPAAGSLDLDL